MEKKPFYDIYEFYYIPFWKSESFKLVFIVIGVILAALLLYKILTYLKRRNVKSLTVWEYTQRELVYLNPENLSSKEEFKKFYFDLSRLLKRYIGDRYKIDLQDKTDNEIEKCLQRRRLNGNLIKALDCVLKGSCFVKFAGQNAIPQKAKADWESACNIVERTIPKDDNK